MSTPSTATASQDLSQALAALVDTNGLLEQTGGSSSQATESAADAPPAASQQGSTDKQPQALLTAFYNQRCQQEYDDSSVLPSNVACCLPPDASLDVDTAIRHAKHAFRNLYANNAAAFESAAAQNDDADSDDEALDALRDVLQSLKAA